MILDRFKKKKKIVVISEPPKNTCGGTRRSIDKNAPKTITSEKMVLFDVTSELRTIAVDRNKEDLIRYVSAFAAPAQKGVFIFLETERGFGREESRESSWALTGKDIFPSLVKLVSDADLVKYNGTYSSTAGLPRNFGGNVNIKYENGEEIDFSNNQTPVISIETAEKIAAIFSESMNGEKISLPDTNSLKEIRFSEKRDDGSFTEAFLTIESDGTGTNRKKQRFDDPKIYESEKKLSKEIVDHIKDRIDRTGLLAWDTLPESEYKSGRIAHLSFFFDDGSEITVDNARALPSQLEGGFFDIQLEITTKG